MIQDIQLRGPGPHCKDPQLGPGEKILEANAHNGFKQRKTCILILFPCCKSCIVDYKQSNVVNNQVAENSNLIQMYNNITKIKIEI